jgi:prephenate dehydrogenase
MPDLPANAPKILAVLGPGLLGGSVAMACRRRLPGVEVRLWARRAEAAAEAEALGVANLATSDLEQAATGADFVVLATPVEVMEGLARRLAAMPLARDAVVTDVGSVKRAVVEAVTPALAGAAQFVGSHPMAGSEKAGISAAREDLFEGSVCLVTPGAETGRDAVERARVFWSALGCRILEMSPERHDREVARISHLPHVMAAVTTLGALASDSAPLRCAANGFRDTTRVASGDPVLWTGILMENREAVLGALADTANHLQKLRDLLTAKDADGLQAFLATAKNLRDLPPPG